MPRQPLPVQISSIWLNMLKFKKIFSLTKSSPSMLICWSKSSYAGSSHVEVLTSSRGVPPLSLGPETPTSPPTSVVSKGPESSLQSKERHPDDSIMLYDSWCFFHRYSMPTKRWTTVFQRWFKPFPNDLLLGRSTVPWRKRRSWAFDKTENGPKVGARMVITTPWKFSVPPLKRSKEPQKETIIFPTRFFRGCLGLGVHWWKVL